VSDQTTQNGQASGNAQNAAQPNQPVPQSSTTPQPANEDETLKDVIFNRVKAFIRGNPAPIDLVIPEEKTVGDIALDADTPISVIVEMLASATGDTADVIRGIEDDKEHPAGKIIIQILILLGYIAPPVLSVLVGIAIGIQYSQGMQGVLGTAIFSVCIFYELGLVWLMFAVIKLARRVMSTGGKGIMGLIGLGIFYVGVAAGSAAAQWVIYEGHIDLSQAPQVAGAVIRTFAVPIVDIICTIALPILIHVSLDKRLAEIEKKTEATIMINKKKIAAQLALIQEAITTKSTLQKEKDYQAKNDLANQLIDLISQKILADARSSLSTGNRRDYTR
jgi:hypothetical protein